MATDRQKICKFIFNKGRKTRVYVILKTILVRGSPVNYGQLKMWSIWRMRCWNERRGHWEGWKEITDKLPFIHSFVHIWIYQWWITHSNTEISSNNFKNPILYFVLNLCAKITYGKFGTGQDYELCWLRAFLVLKSRYEQLLWKIRSPTLQLQGDTCIKKERESSWNVSAIPENSELKEIPVLVRTPG